MNSRTILRPPYLATRLPITVLDKTVVRRLPQDSPPRIALDRAIGSFDQAAGRLLADDAIVRRGTDRIERASKLTEAITLEQDAERKRETASAKAEQGKRAAAEKAQQAKDRAQDGLAEAERTEREGKERAAAAARDLAAKKKKQAEARKQQRVDAIEHGLENVEAEVDTTLTKAQQKAKDKLDAAARTRDAAADNRDQADRLGALTDAKRQARASS